MRGGGERPGNDIQVGGEKRVIGEIGTANVSGSLPRLMGNARARIGLSYPRSERISPCPREIPPITVSPLRQVVSLTLANSPIRIPPSLSVGLVGRLNLNNSTHHRPSATTMCTLRGCCCCIVFVQTLVLVIGSLAPPASNRCYWKSYG